MSQAWELPAALVAGMAADAVWGDPARFHPVAGFGQLALALERRLYRPSRSAGITHASTLVAATTAAVGLLGRRRERPARLAFRAVAVWSVVGARSLFREATLLKHALEAGALDEARRRAPALVGRDPSALDADELARATVESVAENTSDAVVAPLFWCAVAGAPGAVAYRAINTLDAMVGHRNERYREFGWASARLDDLANWPAARLTAALTTLLAPVVGGTCRATATVVARDGSSHPSPNAGQAEAAFAGALSLRLGGPNDYGGRIERRPYLGDGRPPEPCDIERAVRLGRAVSCSALLACCALAWGLRR